MKKTVKYKTHPIYKALAWLMLTVTVAALLFAWAVYASAGAKERLYDAAMRSCEYEAYLSFYEKLGVIAEADSDAEAVYASSAAGEALGRYMLFSGLDADADVLRDLLMSGAVGRDGAAELMRAISSGGSREESVISAIKTAEAWEREVIASPTRDSDGWAWLSSLPEVKETDAARTAARFIGGGGKVRRGESHTFPPVWSYVNGNACADVTRAGGKLIRMYKFRLGSSERRTPEECAASAIGFLREAGIKDAELCSIQVEGDKVWCVFAPPADGDGATPEVVVRVSVFGASVIYFDAYDYYRVR